MSAGKTSPDSVPLPGAAIFSANPVILVVDDEELMREVVSMMIEDNGGRVLVAADGREGVDIYRQHQSDIAYVFMDFSMPDMTGYDAFLEMSKINPAVNALFVSGLNITPEVEALCRQGRAQFLGKPFRERELLAALERLAALSKRSA